MSFIVPMEKPKRCGLCPCFHAEHPMHCQAVKAHKDKRIIAPYGAPIPDWCPLVEIPTPHGRLIDADRIDFRNYAMHDGKGNLVVADNFVNGVMWVNDCIDNAPTAIEAEGEKE